MVKQHLIEIIVLIISNLISIFGTYFYRRIVYSQDKISKGLEQSKVALRNCKTKARQLSFHSSSQTKSMFLEIADNTLDAYEDAVMYCKELLDSEAHLIKSDLANCYQAYEHADVVNGDCYMQVFPTKIRDLCNAATSVISEKISQRFHIPIFSSLQKILKRFHK